MTPEQQAFSSVLPTWTFVRQVGRTGAWYRKGEMQIHLIQLPSGPRAGIILKSKSFYKGAVTKTLEAALEDVKSYLDRAFPGMA